MTAATARQLLDGCAASAGPAIRAVAIKTAVKFLNMVVSSLFDGVEYESRRLSGGDLRRPH